MARVTTNGTELSFEVTGEGAPVLLIAGAGQPASSWEFFGASSLRDGGYQVITFDNRGEAPPGPPPTIVTQNAIVRRFRRRSFFVAQSASAMSPE